MTLTRSQRRNLAKLATYLESLPRRYRHFEMSDFTGLNADDPSILKYAQHNGGIASCGTVACAVGHGPAAGILFRREEIRFDMWDQVYRADWWTYGTRFAPDEDGHFDWAFGGDWSGVDNHHWGAAARIRYLLKHGGPPNGFEDAALKWRKHYREFDKRNAQGMSGSAQDPQGLDREAAPARSSRSEDAPESPGQ